MFYANAIILPGAPNSYARYPKLRSSHETQIAFDFRTKQKNALLLYTDDGAKNGNLYAVTICDGQIQFECRIGDDLIEVPQRRAIITLRVENVVVSDNRWHNFNVTKRWDEIRVQVDNKVQETKIYQRNFVFCTGEECSDVYIGGIPKELYLLPSMSSPLRRYTKTFAGTVKNLIYSIAPHGMTSPPLIKEVGLRQSDEDYCEPPRLSEREEYYCRNEGFCYSTNDGPMCDCSFSEFDGRRCEQPKATAEISFFKDEFLGYDESNNPAAILQYRSENVSFAFKTVHGNAILFVAGHKLNYLYIILENGLIIAISKFEGTEKRVLRSFNEEHSKRYDDNTWHTVTVTRSLSMMVLTVDGRSDKVAQYAPGLYWLTNSYGFVGGLPEYKAKAFKTLHGNFRGCMKKIKYEADAVSINFIELAGYELGESVVKAHGNLAFSCRRPDAHPDVLSFNSGQSYLTLPKWITDASGSIGFELRTRTSDGLILYHGVKDPFNDTSDYVAFELVDGHLFLIINLGSGYVRIEATDSKINDGKVWHSVNLSRVGRSGTVTVDGYPVPFSTPGVSANLNIEDKIFIGAAPWIQDNLGSSEYRFPPTVLMASLRKGYVGCLRNVRVNGISSEIASVYEDQKTIFGDDITLGCNKSLSQDFCAFSPCKNSGRCENGYGNYSCDCSGTYMEGHNCDTEPQVVEFSKNIDPPSIFVLPYTVYGDAETIEFKFRTDKENTILLDTKAENARHRIAVFLLTGKLVWVLRKDGDQHVNILPSNDTVIQINHIAAGYLFAPAKDVYEAYKTDYTEQHFDGQMIKAFFNGFDLLINKRRSFFNFGTERTTLNDRDYHKNKHRKVKHLPVTFETNRGFAFFAQRYLGTSEKLLRVSFRFRTLMSSCLLFASLFDSSRQTIMFALELIDGRVKMTIGYETNFDTVTTQIQNARNLLNDMRWHSVQVYQAKAEPEYYLVVDNMSQILESNNLQNVDLRGDLYLGGLPAEKNFISRFSKVTGFRGCISNFHIGNEILDIQNDSDQVYNVSKGCYGPQIRCNQNPCLNGGKCLQRWTSVICDCSMTTHGGSHCDTPGTTYIFDAASSMIYYEYPASRRPSRIHDKIAFGFQTLQSSAVLLSIQCSAEGDYFVICLKDGFLQVRFNLGQHDHVVKHLRRAVNDNQYHTLRVYRDEANLTIKLDNLDYKYAPQGTAVAIFCISFTPKGNELKTLNEQWRICIGASFARDHHWYMLRKKKRHVFDSFKGIISGVNVNGLMLLDMHARGELIS
ncbi:unnamed protein product [Enterobius vermicularis]|uniref:EGF-like domain-containing protein n=1 Tax=Enterobius vermicularis TaxID=51028 RepID=A0A3P6J224_ENTVE|nr:unnamed protein product [Enterobius vermicularis]